KPQEIFQLHGHQPAGGGRHECMDSGRDFGPIILANLAAKAATDKVYRLLTLLLSLLLLFSAALGIEEAEGIADIDVPSLPPAGERSRIVAAYAGEGGGRPLFRRDKAALIAFEKEKPIAEQIAFLHGLAKARRHDPQVLADDNGLGFP